jgi:large subunit ribosomal protein L1
MDVAAAGKEVKGGKISFRVDKYGIVHTSVGRVSFTPEHIMGNAMEILSTLLKMKPAAAKGTYMKSITLVSTMSPGISIDSKSIR